MVKLMSWTRRITITAIVASLILAALLLFTPILSIGVRFYSLNSGMREGQRYMDSLTDTDIQRWIERSKEYLAHADPQQHPIGAVPVPDDLKTHGIRRIDLWPDQVVYVWVGGLDHTLMSVRRTNGSYQVYARYNENTGKAIWPRGTNQ